MNSKASLQEAMGAIITLIIGIAVLGLVLSFLGVKFGVLSERIDAEEVTPEPTSDVPITLPDGKDSIVLQKSDESEFTIKVYNGESSDILIGSDGNVYFDCVDSSVGQVEVIVPSMRLSAGEITTIPALLKVSRTAEQGKTQCELIVGTISKKLFVTVK